MNTGPFLLVTEAPLDEHTAALLREFTPADVIVLDGNSPREALLGLVSLARRSESRLVVADTALRAESNALANLLDDPTVTTGVLLAHNAADEVAGDVFVAGSAVVANGTHGATASSSAGIFVVGPGDFEAFAERLLIAAETVSATASDADVWDAALQALVASTDVRAVVADPFCASRGPMELPHRSEDDRRLRAAVQRTGDPATPLVLGSVSRRVTSWAVNSGRRPTMLTASGLVTGLVAATLVALGTFVATILGALFLLAAMVLLLSDGQTSRYWRRPDAAAARLHRLAVRVVELAFLVGLGFGAAGSGWLLVTAAAGMVAVITALVAGRNAVGDDTATGFRSLRWLAIAVVVAVGGPDFGLIAAICAAAAASAVIVVRALRSPRAPRPVPPTSKRFLQPLGSFADAGVLVRILGLTFARRVAVPARVAMTGAVAVVALGAMLSWGRNPWLLVFAGAAFIILLSTILAAPLRGAGAWAVPALLRAVEVLAMVTVASALVTDGGAAGAAAVVAMTLLTAEAVDRWRTLDRAPQAWVPVADLGFDGRIAVATILGTFGLAVGALWAIAVLLGVLWIATLVTHPRRSTDA